MDWLLRPIRRLLGNGPPEDVPREEDISDSESHPHDDSAGENVEYIARICGHHTAQHGEVTAHGQTVTMHMPLNEDGGVDYCLACIGRMTIQCAWCDEPIFIGSPVTLYTPSSKEFVLPKHAIVYNQEPLQLVGCLGWDCAITGGDRAGFWVPGDDGKGEVMRVMSPLEMAFSGSAPVIVGDLSSMPEAMDLQNQLRDQQEYPSG